MYLFTELSMDEYSLCPSKSRPLRSWSWLRHPLTSASRAAPGLQCSSEGSRCRYLCRGSRGQPPGVPPFRFLGGGGDAPALHRSFRLPHPCGDGAVARSTQPPAPPQGRPQGRPWLFPLGLSMLPLGFGLVPTRSRHRQNARCFACCYG